MLGRWEAQTAHTAVRCVASRREGERVGDFQIEWSQPVYAPVQVRLAHTSSGLSTAAISFDAYPQGKCALCGKKDWCTTLPKCRLRVVRG